MAMMTLPSFRAYRQSVWSLITEGSASSGIIRGLIHDVECASGYARNDARATAKSWLISHRASLTPQEVLLAEAHFGYLLPGQWASRSE